MITPCHIIDLDQLYKNLRGPIRRLREEAGCKVLLAIKGFSSETILPYMIEDLDGISASGAFESILGKNIFGKKMICTFSPAYQENTIQDIVQNSNLVIFNSLKQYESFSDWFGRS
mgnify:FL=1